MYFNFLCLNLFNQINETLAGLFSYLYRTNDQTTLNRIRKPVYEYLCTLPLIGTVNMNLIGILNKEVLYFYNLIVLFLA